MKQNNLKFNKTNSKLKVYKRKNPDPDLMSDPHPDKSHPDPQHRSFLFVIFKAAKLVFFTSSSSMGSAVEP